MSEKTHTPGPWDCWDMDEFGWHVFADQFGTREQGQDCRLSIAAIRPGRSHTEPSDNYYEQVANARLIAAAPAMLEALALWQAADSETEEAVRQTARQIAREKRDAALSKARGETP